MATVLTDIDQIYLKVHMRVARVMNRMFPPFLRIITLWFLLLLGIWCIALLFLLHSQHLWRVSPRLHSITPHISCFSSLSEYIHNSSVDVVKLRIKGPWSKNEYAQVGWGGVVHAYHVCDNQQHKHYSVMSKYVDCEQLLKSGLRVISHSNTQKSVGGYGFAVDALLDSMWQFREQNRQLFEQVFPVVDADPFHSLWTLFHTDADPEYWFAPERGVFFLQERTLSARGFRFVNVTMDNNHPCFGSSQLRFFTHYVGYETILKNELLRMNLTGFMFDMQYGSVVPVDPTTHMRPRSPISWLVRKVEHLVTVAFIFFAITTLVSFTLRSTQTRMLSFATQLRHQIRSGLPSTGLVLRHVLESVAFVPGVLGLLFFLFEFFQDQAVAIIVLTLAWVGEFYSVMVVRSTLSMYFFPKVFGMYFLLFGMYTFSFPNGFHQLASIICIIFVAHAAAYFYFQVELPAVLRGHISPQVPRMLHAHID